MVPAAAGKRTPEEVERLKAEAAARRAAKATESGEAAVPTPVAAAPEPEAVPAAAGKRTPEEIERLKAEAVARRAAKASGETPAPVPEAAPAPVAEAVSTEPPAAEVSQGAVTGVGAKRTPEEIERLKAEAAARRVAKAGQGSGQ